LGKSPIIITILDLFSLC